jgi:hypothetical protein
MNRWWAGDARERFWLETTNRTDIGVDLKAPSADDRGAAHPAYALIQEVGPADLVLHCETKARRIAMWSRVASDPFPEDLVRGSHGAVAGAAGVVPYRRPGWRALLEGPFDLPEVLSLEEMRARR